MKVCISFLIALLFYYSLEAHSDTLYAKNLSARADTLLQQKHKYDSAVFYLDKAAAIYRQLAWWEDYVLCLNKKSQALQQMNQWGKALRLSRYLARQIPARLGSHHPGQVANYRHLGDIHAYLQNYDSALIFYGQAIATLQETCPNQSSEMPGLYNKLGDVFYHRARQPATEATHHYLAALQAYQQSLICNLPSFKQLLIYRHPPLQQLDSGWLQHQELLHAMHKKALVFRDLYFSNRQEQDKLAAEELFTRLDSLLAGEIQIQADVSRWATQAGEIYRQAAAFYLRLADSDSTTALDCRFRAFEYSEKNKAASLLAAMADARPASFTGLPDSLHRRELLLKEQIAACGQSLYRPNACPQDSLHRLPLEQLSGLWQQHRQLHNKLRQDFAAYYALRYRLTAVSAAQIQKQLTPYNLLISFFIDDSLIYAFHISRKDFLLTRVASSAIAEKQVYAMRQGILSQDARLYTEAAHQLYRLLFPQDLPAGIQKLILIPDQWLCLLPFEALLTQPPSAPAAQYQQHSYLISRYSVFYQHSASLFYELSTQKQKTRSVNHFLGFTPAFSTPFRYRGYQVSAISGSANEVSDIYNYYQANLFDAGYFTREDASKSNFQALRLRDYGQIHLATHNFTDYQSPEHSGLLFAADSGQSQPGLLRHGEVYGLSLNADLLVLPGSEIQKNAELLRLTRGWFYAGTRNLLYSLWRVPVASGNHLMLYFYQEAIPPSPSNTSPGFPLRHFYPESLRAAKLRMISGKNYAAPYYWSSFLLLGQ